MSTTKPIITAKDSTTFTLSASDLKEKEVGEAFTTPEREIPSSGGLQWWIRYYPAGYCQNSSGHVGVYFWVSKPVKAKWTVAVDGTIISVTHTYEFTTTQDSWGNAKFANHEQLLARLFRDGKLIITCSVEFKISTTFSVPPNSQLFCHVPTDVMFAIGPQRVPVKCSSITYTVHQKVGHGFAHLSF